MDFVYIEICQVGRIQPSKNAVELFSRAFPIRVRIIFESPSPFLREVAKINTIQRLNTGIWWFDLSVNRKLTIHEISNGRESLLTIKDFVLSGLCIFYDMNRRYVPIAKNTVD